MPLSDDLIVYPNHGAGSACGKNMSKETTDTLGNQKRTNYALRADMTREEFKKELLTGLTAPPAYFPKNVLMNIQGYESLDRMMDRGMRALRCTILKWWPTRNFRWYWIRVLPKCSPKDSFPIA
jgi:hydroxyacylglutathione hydrolase